MILSPNVKVGEGLSLWHIVWPLWLLLPVKPEVTSHLKEVKDRNVILSTNVKVWQGLSLWHIVWPLWPLLPFKPEAPSHFKEENNKEHDSFAKCQGLERSLIVTHCVTSVTCTCGQNGMEDCGHIDTAKLMILIRRCHHDVINDVILKVQFTNLRF